MMTQNIPIQAPGIQSQAVGSATFAKRSGGNQFDLILAGSIKGETKITVKSKTINMNAKNVNAQDKRQSTDGKESIMSMTQDNKAKVSDSINISTQTVQNLSKEDKDSEEVFNSDRLGLILLMLGQIKNAIMEELEMTPEELDSLMTKVGLNLSDLTDSQAIMSLLLADKGITDPFVILMDEQMGDTYQSLIQNVNNIKSEANLMLTDDEIRLLTQESKAVKDFDVFIGAGETKTLQPVISSNQSEDDTVEDKDKIISLQAETEDSDIREQVSVITSKSDKETTDNDDSMAKSDKADGFEAFLNKLGANYDKPIVEFTGNNVRLYDIKEIAQQIIDKIRVIINPEQTTMELQLNPEHLGKVNLTVSSKEGVMTAHFAVQNDLAKEAVEGQLITLKDTLAQQGIKVESIEVTVASYTFDQRSPSDEAEQQMQKKQRSGHKITFEEAVAMSEEPLEEIDAIPTGTTGYTINYTA